MARLSSARYDTFRAIRSAEPAEAEKEPSLKYETGEKDTDGAQAAGVDMYDEHHLTYAIGDKWPKGSADRQDWAKPGKLWK